MKNFLTPRRILAAVLFVVVVWPLSTFMLHAQTENAKATIEQVRVFFDPTPAKDWR